MTTMMTVMKIGLVALMSLGSFMAMAASKPIDLRCRSFDYFELAGNRRVIEVLLTQEGGGTYEAKVAHVFETLSSGQYVESSRSVEMDLPGLTCIQADPNVDLKVISCSNSGVKSYFGISRIDQTVIMSPYSSSPGSVVKTTTYEGTIFSGGREEDGTKNELRFDPRDCELK